MTLPWRGAYVVLSLDPASSLKDIDDPIVNEELRKMKCGRYVATATEDHHPLSALMPQRTFTWDFITQGIPPDVPEALFKSYMTVPILPNTTHPESRRPVEPVPHLPWDDCYHARLYRTIAICPTLDTEENPQSCLSPEEAAVLDQYISTDNNYSVLCERAKQDGEYPPPHDVPAQVLMAIRLANKRRRTDGKPWWAIVRERAQERARKQQAEEAARAVALQGSDPPAATPLSNGLALHSSLQERENFPSSDVLPTHAAVAPPVMASPPSARASRKRDGSNSDSGSSTPGPEGMLAALLGLNELEKQLPWVKIESYDIRQFDVPPHPSGFFEELKELKRIRNDYIERQKKRLEDVQRQDADFMASIEARGRSVSGLANQPFFARLLTSTSTYTIRMRTAPAS
ncbi:hypothetical protein K525DRAFT_203380 [Schizophyllum commune Loenen D]|nr:hypothetical protein K525DRAFT_203380 [Schizophyllum commune Loenen D]